MNMNLKEELQEALKEAMRAGDKRRKKTLRMALAEIKNKEIEKGEALEDSENLGILQKEVKSRQETIEGAEQADRPDLIQEAEAEIDILEEYLPQPLSHEELRSLVEEVISEVGAESMADMGKVMGALMPKIRGRADGKETNEIVRDVLGS
jgi:uncharacterized protein YqeY